MRKLSLSLLLVFTGAFFIFSQKHKENVYSTSSGAIDGYDPVAYFVKGKAMKGNKENTCEWNGSTWHFVSEENKSMFIENPNKYMPEYGGFCAFAMAKGHKVKIDPKAWTIENDKLYLNYDKGVQKSWMMDMRALIIKADENWKKIKEE